MNKQELPITVRLKVQHSPDNEAHIKHVVQEYLRSKGVHLSDDLVIEV